MTKNALQTAIAVLAEELRRVTQIDVHTRNSLVSLQQEIDRALDERSEVSLPDRLEELAVRFENKHPALGNALRQTIDALAKAGI